MILRLHGPWRTAHGFSYIPEVWKPGMKTSRTNGYENSLVKLPERQLWLKDLAEYEKYEKGMKTPYLKVPWKSCIIIIVPGLPPKGRKTKVSVHTLPRV